MKFQFNETASIEFKFNKEGEVEFRHEGKLYRSVGQPTFDNSPNNNFSTYSAPLVCPEDTEYPDETAGKIEWDIISRECEDESYACNWNKFSIYFF